ncbi:hypothetical protein IQ277_24610 [Nostocales cyanobacterium LEGE 12452]|nr:hypothetical protein [Nostocales cyanobacterium LEGE 12452]
MTTVQPSSRAILCLISVGSEADASNTGSSYDDLPANHVVHNLPPALQPTRLLSSFRRGFIKVIVALLLGQAFPFGHFFPQPLDY